MFFLTCRHYDALFSSTQFGESQKLRLVRILRSTVMVRVGGGWVALDEFLVKNDPCRGVYYTQYQCLVFKQKCQTSNVVTDIQYNKYNINIINNLTV